MRPHSHVSQSRFWWPHSQAQSPWKPTTRMPLGSGLSTLPCCWFCCASERASFRVEVADVRMKSSNGKVLSSGQRCLLCGRVNWSGAALGSRGLSTLALLKSSCSPATCSHESGQGPGASPGSPCSAACGCASCASPAPCRHLSLPPPRPLAGTPKPRLPVPAAGQGRSSPPAHVLPSAVRTLLVGPLSTTRC